MSLFDKDKFRKAEYLYFEQKNRETLVKFLQSKWPNCGVEFVKGHGNYTISLVIDGEKIRILTYPLYSYMTDNVIVKHLVSAIKDLKRQKRKAIMGHLLNIERYTT